MRNLLLVIAMLLTFVLPSACTNSTSNPVETITADVISTVLATAIDTSLSCTGTAAVQADVTKIVDGWFNLQTNVVVDKTTMIKSVSRVAVSSASTSSSTLNTLCMTAVTAILPSLIQSGSALVIKPTWQCSLTSLNDAINVIGTLACSKI